ncbi:uncharacterized protein BDW70DRAFT_122821 [Aspergillus foveolatus]|uniref:uncharacterized protein n=1 Tax=Aspergillus foveolatus TaxID=210207 RepID=UPI003CCDE96D
MRDIVEDGRHIQQVLLHPYSTAPISISCGADAVQICATFFLSILFEIRRVKSREQSWITYPPPTRSIPRLASAAAIPSVPSPPPRGCLADRCFRSATPSVAGRWRCCDDVRQALVLTGVGFLS